MVELRVPRPKTKTPQGRFNIQCVCHTSLKLRVALLRVNCSAPACHPKRHRREGWLGQLDCSWLCHSPHVRFKRRIFSICLFSPTIVSHQTTFVVWSNCASHVQKQKRHRGVLIFGWGSWIRTNTDGVRVRSSTVKLCPNVGAIIYCMCLFCNLFFYLWLGRI